jgi:predicted dehydrogenase
MDRILIGLYGSNGHQIQELIANNPHAHLAGICRFETEKLPCSITEDSGIKRFNSLDQMLQCPEIKLISLCSPRRDEQAGDAVKCLKAGKHVYSEKPCAMTEQQLDEIIQTAKETGCRFHEMAGTSYLQPYLEMAKIIASGTIGTVVQVLAQKSYPFMDWRPQDEGIDGGLLMQVGIHAVRMIEQVAGTRIASVTASETAFGNPEKDGGLRMASSMSMKLENGGIATVIANYLNPPAFDSWGNETLRVFGTKGFIETTDGGTKTRLVLNEADKGSIAASEPGREYFDMYISSLLGGEPMPLTIEDELHPTRIVIRAKESIQKQ